MQKEKISRVQTNLFSDLSNQLVYNQNDLLEFIDTPFTKEAFQIKTRQKKENYSSEIRNTLVKELKSKYSEIKTNELVLANIEKLNNDMTYTVTTGHQLSLFTGPIYFIYKILNTIKLAEYLNLSNTGFSYVPVFWMASEDHDFEEIQSISLFNKEIKWETNQTGAVGRFDLTDFNLVKDSMLELFKNDSDSEVYQLLESIDGHNYGDATFKLINRLFEKYGLIIIDGDNKAYKEIFKPIIKNELKTNFSFDSVNETNKKLEIKKIKRQLTAREINLFYLHNQERTRIIKEEQHYKIEGVGSFDLESILNLVEENPENFSPNVVLRPLFQETLLPNICYIGGGGEISYWLQLKQVFNSTKTTYPLLSVRNSFQLIDSISKKKMDKLSLNNNDLFKDTDILKKDYVLSNSSDLDFEHLEKLVTDYTVNLEAKIQQINEGLINFGKAESVKIKNQLNSIKKKLIKSEKEKNEQSLNQIEQLKERLFPNGKPQERVINFFSICNDGQIKKHLDDLYDAMDPFEKDFIILTQ